MQCLRSASFGRGSGCGSTSRNSVSGPGFIFVKDIIHTYNNVFFCNLRAYIHVYKKKVIPKSKTKYVYSYNID